VSRFKHSVPKLCGELAQHNLGAAAINDYLVILNQPAVHLGAMLRFEILNRDRGASIEVVSVTGWDRIDFDGHVFARYCLMRNGSLTV
jgi:hypothetical protein